MTMVFSRDLIAFIMCTITVCGFVVNSDGITYDPEASISANQLGLMKIIKHFKSCTKVTCGNFEEIAKMSHVVHKNQNDINLLVNVVKDTSMSMMESITQLTAAVRQNTEDIGQLKTVVQQHQADVSQLSRQATRNQEDIGLMTSAIKEAFLNNHQLVKENQGLMKENQELFKEVAKRTKEDNNQLTRSINMMVQRNQDDIHKLTTFLQPQAVGEQDEHRVVERASPHLENRLPDHGDNVFHREELADCSSEYFELGGQCFRAYISNTVSWEAGRRICRQEGAELAQPRNLRQLAIHLSRNIRETWYWLGGQGDGTHARWISGELLSSDTPWASREPGDQVSTSQCLDLRASHNYPISGPLYANDCSGTSYVLCECSGSCARENNP
ncbi:unnamed protein product [Meganyctiphanes norvegica]|uniref:C-type lectin domain-containing protein n=1 Tax=Meganyctiphanes norvegica TaxID=48144 RepID=A0AAV2RE53_MEGNR